VVTDKISELRTDSEYALYFSEVDYFDISLLVSSLSRPNLIIFLHII